jgi:inosine triphosphate pyrophosphatase
MQQVGHVGLNNMLAAYEDKSAEAVCTFGYCAGPGQDPILFEGRTAGNIVPARGPTTFGWDAVFEYQGQTLVLAVVSKNFLLTFVISYAEMDKAKKNGISHRGKALQKLREWLEKNHI